MINLLPTDKKAEIRAARTNVILVRYITIIILALAFILGSMYITYTVLGLTKTSSEQTIAANDIKAGAYSDTKTQVDALSASLAETKVLLDQETRYSKVLVNIAQIMPAGTLFGPLALDDSSFVDKPVSTIIYAKTTAEMTALTTAFQSSPLFTSMTFQTPVETGSSIAGYPVNVSVTFLLTEAATL